VLTPISFGSRFDDFFIEPLIRHPDGRPPQLCLLPKPFNPADAGKIRNEKVTFCLSSTYLPTSPHLSTDVAWREKKFKHFVFYKYFSLVLGLLKSRISEKTI
jgi:hypothetical protein